MKKLRLVVVLGVGAFLALLPASARAEQPEQDGTRGRLLFTEEGKAIHVMPPHGGAARGALGSIEDIRVDGDEDEDDDTKNGAGSPAAAGGNLIYHKGPVILQAQEKSLFWGSWGSSDVPGHMSSFFSQFGTSAQYVTITQYYNTSNAKIQTTNLGGLNYFDTTTPPSTVTDSIAQQALTRNFQNGNLGTPNASTVYFLYLPNGVTSTIGGSSSCTSYCGYHSNYTYGGVAIKYAVMPYPSCGGCQGSAQAGLSIAAASLTITSGHEMREAATDALGTAWYDRRGYEADDKCAWQLFLAGGFQHQKEWSNSVSGCVQGGITGP